MKRLLAPITLVAVLAALATAGCESSAGDAPAANTAAPLNAEAQSALAALPADARLLAVADAQALRRSGIFEDEKKEAYTGEARARLKDFLDATGFDPAEDVQKVYLAAPRSSARSSGGPPQLALAADFDRARFREQLNGEWGDRFEKSTYQGQSIYRSTRGQNDHSLAFALTDGGLILLSGPAGVRRMLDRLDAGSGSAGQNDVLMRLADRVRGRGDTWFVARGLPSFSTTTNGANANGPQKRFQRLQKVVKNAAGAFSVSENAADGELFLYTQPGADPADLREVLEGLVSAARKSEKLSARHRKVLDSIEIEERGDEAVRVDFSFPMSDDNE